MAQVWRPDDIEPPVPETPGSEIFRPDILDEIEKKIEEMSKELNDLSLDIHAHPELKYEESRTHDVLTVFMSEHGFQVEKHYLLPTAWLATYKHGQGGRTIGVNSEMDALPGVGHACGHNLIAIAGVAVACAMKAVLEQFDISATIQLLGTPAEEGGGGKIKLLEKGAYEDMAACLMCHPAPGPKGSVSLSGSLAIQQVTVEYFGHTAHAALSPWEGINALDAAVLAYNNISALRQQLKPTARVHGIFEGKDWAVNVIPDYAKYICYIRAPNAAELDEVVKRILPCFPAAAQATGCEHKITMAEKLTDIHQNKALGEEVARIVKSRYGGIDFVWGIAHASTDFGNITYGTYRFSMSLRFHTSWTHFQQALPSLHPGFAIPTVLNGGNHTRDFAAAAATPTAHQACLDVSKALAATGIRVLIDDNYFAEVKKTFEEREKF
ncbi:hypothetical protein F5050DRAFT_1767933 [Lentinula boryana]|uniref:Peptidase M20 domain-containing protein 2 n=1 Tax=Lentinula boryana TaxID=40481 RepID=A0ABQ8QA11_9AGAR|nr:hypothetical protein F5050DRAFT_1767933 [Lentinula boryana]